jgi:flagellar hook-length control protein FliK
MVQTPQVPSSKGVAALPPSPGRAVKNQAGDVETFASLLDGQSGGVPATANAAETASAQLLGENASGKKGSAATAGGSGGGQSSGTAGTVPAANSEAQQGQRSSYQMAGLARLPLAAFTRSDPNGVPAKKNVGTQGSTSATEGKADAKSGGSESTATAKTPGSSPPLDANSVFLAAQLQAASATRADGQQQGGREPSGGSGTAKQAVGQGGLPASTMNGQANPNPAGNAPQAAVASDSTNAANASAVADSAGSYGTPGEAQAASLGATLATEAIANAITQSQSSSSAASVILTAENAPGLTVKDVRTHLVPEKLTIKSETLNSPASDSASTLAEIPGAAEIAASAEQQISQPVTGAAGNSSRRDHPSGEAAGTEAANAQPAQAAGAGAIPPDSAPGQGALSPAQQIFDAIKSAAPTAGGNAQQAQASDPTAAAIYEPLKTITIALQPDGMGTVSIQLSLKSSQLALRLEASETSTVQLLRQNSDDLSGLLQSAGYTVGSIAVHSAPQTQGDAQAQTGQGGQGNASNPSGSGGSGAGSGSAGAGGQAQAERGGGQKEGGYGRTETPDSDSSLYV